jgi:hypothetical protein
MSDTSQPTAAILCPYRGLWAFREEDARFFHGREAAAAELLRAVGRTSLVAVVGASGSGKSSLVQAGLLPRLRAGANGAVWDAVAMVPGERPLHGLAAAFGAGSEPARSAAERVAETGQLAAGLARGAVSLSEVVAAFLARRTGRSERCERSERSETERLLLVVDRWEELYTLCRDGRERERFHEQILSAAGAAPVTVVLTLRADLFGQALSHRALADRLQAGHVSLGPMTRGELQEAIERPAEVAGLRLEPGLSAAILQDLRGAPDELPSLQVALRELWKRREQGALTQAAYRAVGGVEGAIARSADAAYAALSDDQKVLARRALLRLVQIGGDATDSTRRESAAEWGEAARPVIDRLVDAGLLVQRKGAVEGGQSVEVAHEALLRRWDSLRGWIEEARSFLGWRQRLRAAMADRGRDPRAPLLAGPRLPEATRWQVRRGEELTAAERTFIDASATATRRRNRLAVAGVAIFVAAALLLGRREGGEPRARRGLPALQRSQLASARFRVGVVNASTVVSDEQLARAVPALQRQLHDDFAPVWGVDADLQAVGKGQRPPADAWTLTIEDPPAGGAAGAPAPRDRAGGIPAGRAFASPAAAGPGSWTVAASRQLLGLLVNPRVDLMVDVGEGPQRFVANDVTQPCGPASYDVDGVAVSDFVYPAWFDATRVPDGARIDHLGRMERPLQILPGGSVTYLDVGGAPWRQRRAP